MSEWHIDGGDDEIGPSCLMPELTCPRVRGARCLAAGAAAIATANEGFANANTDRGRTDLADLYASRARAAYAISQNTQVVAEAMRRVAETTHCTDSADNGSCAQDPAMNTIIELVNNSK